MGNAIATRRSLFVRLRGPVMPVCSAGEEKPDFNLLQLVQSTASFLGQCRMSLGLFQAFLTDSELVFNAETSRMMEGVNAVPIFFATLSGDSNKVGDLITHCDDGANLDSRSNSGATALHLAAHIGRM
eukprot:2463505-Rhodomonas_salina.1